MLLVGLGSLAGGAAVGREGGRHLGVDLGTVSGEVELFGRN